MAGSSSFDLSYLLLGQILLFLFTTTAHSLTCSSQTFSNKKTFDNCVDLPKLNANLHWTYSSDQSTLSMAFTAPPPESTGWVSWALNPDGTGMVGAQALIALKLSDGTMSVNTYDIKSYNDLVEGPISYNVTGISAQQSDGKITIFGIWALPEKTKKVNQVWQVGPVSDGKIGKHEFLPENLNAVGTLSLEGGRTGSSPSRAPITPPAGAPIASPAGAPAVTKESGSGSAPAAAAAATTGSSIAPSPAASGAGESLMKKLGICAFTVFGTFTFFSRFS